MEAIQLRHHTHIKWCGDIPVFTVTMHAQVMVVTVEEDITDHAFVTMEGKDDWFISCEDFVKFFI